MSIEDTRKKYSSLAMFAKRGLMTTSSPSDNKAPSAPEFKPVGTSAVSSDSGYSEASLAADRADLHNPFFRDITPKKELLISLSAAKLLTDLTAAVVKSSEERREGQECVCKCRYRW